jgi:hypothetical protein
MQTREAVDRKGPRGAGSRRVDMVEVSLGDLARRDGSRSIASS